MQNYSPEEPTNEKDNAVALKIKNSLFKIFPPHDLCEDDCNISSKINFILYLAHKLVIEEEHKVLVFSQSPHMLKILEQALGSVIDKEKIVRMDGSTKRRDRNRMRMAFQCQQSRKESPNSESSGSSISKSSDLDLSKVCEPWIFLMTTRVGGVGLNLTAATRVIIADPSENPSDDNQAVDRAYRMGQTKDVIVYQLVTCAAIEEHTYREQILKIETSFGILGEQPCMKSICEKEGLVLTLPPFGFKFCKTHRELVRIYGLEMNIVLSDLGLHHEAVIAAHYHSLLFSVKEDEVDDYEMEVLDPKQGKSKSKEIKKRDEVIQYIKIDLPPEAERAVSHQSKVGGH
ncbi:protein CHROMATIN REMODELING 24 isoform X2 [Setaria italica]|uniref:protein CHROMATIN REMODELING 24 isoform X2 n=1 Tax=Setaria italica TaxID=4555 RepID=UPI000BE5F08D|nr:protein CHROMATIN REMODELING 24 isoform X2 [Setaria italica]